MYLNPIEYHPNEAKILEWRSEVARRMRDLLLRVTTVLRAPLSSTGTTGRAFLLVPHTFVADHESDRSSVRYTNLEIESCGQF